MVQRPFEALQPNLILVEGKDDKFVFEHLLKDLQITNAQVHSVESKSQFERFLIAERKSEGFEIFRTISVIADADDSRETSLTELRGALRAVGLPVPTVAGEFTPGPPSILVECIPVGRDSGALEDVILEAIESRAGTMPCWGDLRQCLEGKLPQAAGFNEARWNKIRLQLVLNCSLRGYKTGLLFALQSREYAGLLDSGAFDPLRETLQKVQAEHRRISEQDPI